MSQTAIDSPAFDPPENAERFYREALTLMNE